MLPEVLSADVCSLKAGADRAAMACHLTIDAHGRVKDWRFTRALVRIAEVIAYEDAQARIDAGEAGENLQQPVGRVEALLAGRAQRARSARARAARAPRACSTSRARSPRSPCASGSTRTAWSRTS